MSAEIYKEYFKKIQGTYHEVQDNHKLQIILLFSHRN
jgi:hypothetical protein